MNLRHILYLILICIFSLGCSLKPDGDSLIQDDVTQQMIQSVVDSNSVALVTFKLEGKTVPGTPKVVSAMDSASALFERMGISAELQQINDSTWIGLLMIEHSYVIGWIAEDKKLFGYCSEPFVAAQDLVVTFSPGTPVTFEYDLTETPDDIQVFPAEVFLPVKTFSRGLETFLSWGEQKTIDEPGIVKIEGLAPGKYEILARCSDSQKYQYTRIPYLYDKREIEIKADSANRFKSVFPEIDSTIEQGDVTVRGILTDSVKQPLPDMTMELIPLENMDLRLDLYYPDITTDSNGVFEFTGVRPNITAILKCTNMGVLLIPEIMRENATISVDMVIGANTLIFQPDITIENIAIDFQEGNLGTILDFTGKTLVTEVWTSWCPLCKESLSELNSLAEQLSQQDDIVFLALSIDADREVWERTVENSGWGALRHAWFDQKKNVNTFNKPIPYSFIMDKDGIIRMTGYNLDIGLELEKLAKTGDSTED